MKSQWVFCSACDRMVRVQVSEGSPDGEIREIQDAQVACLEIGVNCTGNMCPLGGVAPQATQEAHPPRESPD